MIRYQVDIWTLWWRVVLPFIIFAALYIYVQYGILHLLSK